MASYTKTATAFVNRQSARNGNMFSTGHEVFSYDQCIARWVGPSTVEVTSRKFSVTTSAHTSAIVAALLNDGFTEGEGTETHRHFHGES